MDDHTFKASIELKFLNNYNNLNEQQKLAVDSIDGPVMVVAGPGTGKTQILSMRIASILLKTDSKSNNILCLTYTDEGVKEMKNRLNSIIGINDVNVFTFHAFCKKIIDENQIYFNTENYDLLSELEELNIYKKLIEDLPSNNILKKERGDVHSYTNILKNLFDLIQKETIQHKKLIEELSIYVESLHKDEKFQYKVDRRSENKKKGDPNHKKILAETIKVRILQASLNEFDNYKKKLLELKRFTFGDLIEKIVQCFSDENYIIARYQEQYQYVLVDEFQDSNGAQMLIIQKLLSYWDEPNLFVVGDEDQCIYRFQGANFLNFQKFKEQYLRKSNPIVLKHNYRSTSEILKVAHNLISNNNSRFENKILHSVKSDTKNFEQTLPKVNIYRNSEQEIIGVIEEIKLLLRNNASLSLSDIAILYPHNKIGIKAALYLKNQNIPYNLSKEINILNEELILHIISILNYLSRECKSPFSSKESLFQILHFDFFDYSAFQIANDYFEFNNSEKTTYKNSFRYYLITIDAESIKYPLIAILERMIKNVNQKTVYNLTIQILNELKILDWIMKQKNHIWYIEIVNTFLNFIDNECKKYNYNLHEFISEILDVYEKENIAVTAVQHITSKNGINLKTFHSSKGREFEAVFLINCVDTAWEKKKKINQIKIPNQLISYGKTEDDDIVIEEELRRLFYVGITRAKKYLYLTYSTNSVDNSKILLPTKFITELQGSEQLETVQHNNVTLNEEVLFNYSINRLKILSSDSNLNFVNKDLINKKLLDFNLSFSAFNIYLKCPISFYFEVILGIPSETNIYIEFGNVLHSSLEDIYKNMLLSKDKRFMDLTSLLDNFNTKFERRKHLFTKYEFEQNKIYGNKLLTKYYNNFIVFSNKNVSIEKKAKVNFTDTLSITGRFDKIEIYNNQCIIVDYKTGVYKSEKFSLPREGKEFGGEYWRQAVWYKILYDMQAYKSFDINSVTFQFVYFNPSDNKDDFKQITVTPSINDIHIIKKEILNFWVKLKNYQFNTYCESEHCLWCSFVRQNFHNKEL